jgi:hypothetical protein
MRGQQAGGQLNMQPSGLNILCIAVLPGECSHLP